MNVAEFVAHHLAKVESFCAIAFKPNIMARKKTISPKKWAVNILVMLWHRKAKQPTTSTAAERDIKLAGYAWDSSAFSAIRDHLNDRKFIKWVNTVYKKPVYGGSIGEPTSFYISEYLVDAINNNLFVFQSFTGPETPQEIVLFNSADHIRQTNHKPIVRPKTFVIADDDDGVWSSYLPPKSN